MTPMGHSPFQNLPVVDLIREFPTLYRTPSHPSFITVFTTANYRPILILMSPVVALQSYLRSILILSSGLRQGSVSRLFSFKTPKHKVVREYRHVPRLFNSPSFEHPIDIWESIQISKLPKKA